MSSLCNSCGHLCPLKSEETPLDECRRAFGLPCGVCTQMTEVNREVLEAQEALKRVLDKQRRLKTHFNSCHDTFICRLPLELATRIFDCCMLPTPTLENLEGPEVDGWLPRETPLDKTFRPQLRIGAVCRQWRQIMWSNPQFWNIIYLRVSSESQPYIATILKDWVLRSGELPLFISIQYYQASRLPPAQSITQLQELLLSIVSTLSTCIHRWSLVNLCLPKSYMTMLRSNMSSLSTLSSLKGLALSITADPDEDTRYQVRIWIHDGAFDTSLVLKPQQLSLEGLFVRNVQVDVANLTSFKGTQMLVIDCLELIRRAPQMVDCTLEALELSPSFNGLPIYPSTTILHTSIERLRLVDCPDELLDHIICPELWDLTICGAISGRLSNQLTEFIKRSKCCLESFEVKVEYLEQQVLLDFLKLTPTLRSLDISQVGDNFFKQLGSTTYTARGSEGFLPQLHSFNFSGYRSFQWSSVPLLVPAAQDQDMNGRPLREIDFRINSDPDDLLPGRDEPLGPDDVDLIDEASVHAISDLVERGIRIQITDVNHNLDLIDASMKHHGISEES